MLVAHLRKGKVVATERHQVALSQGPRALFT